MPNGKPGDHPFTDILRSGSSEFGEPVDGLVRELSQMQGFASVQRQVSYLLESLSPWGVSAEQRKSKVVEAVEKLQRIKQQLELFQK